MLDSRDGSTAFETARSSGLAEGAPPRLAFAGFVLVPATRELLHGESRVAAEPKVFDLLDFLLRNPGRVVTRQELTEAVWPDVVTTPGSLNRAVSLAREALGDRGREQPIIETMRGVGYRISVPVVQLDDADAGEFFDRPSEVAAWVDSFEQALARRGARVVISDATGTAQPRLREAFVEYAATRSTRGLRISTPPARRMAVGQP